MPKKLLIFLALLATVVPALYVLNQVGGIEKWQGVPPQGITDSLIYYARMHEVADGHPFVGNPFVYEYRDSYSPGFFIPDILSSIPLLVGLPLNGAIVFNLFVWSLIFLWSTYILLRALKVGAKWIIPITGLVYVSSYAFMLRPTVMQTIFPLFLLWLTALLLFLYEPNSHKRVVYFASASALTFYFYNFLAFVVFVTCAALLVWFVASKQYRALQSLIRMGVYTTMFLVPFGIYSFIQMGGPLYKETLIRMGMVYTHIPAIEAFFFGRWIVVGLVAFAILWYFLPLTERGHTERRVFWVASGFGLFTCLFLNVITGVEYTLAIHIGRLAVVWLAILFGVLLYEWYSAYFNRKSSSRYIVHAAVGFFIFLLAVGVARNIPRALGFFSSDNREVSYSEVQEYAAPLLWLEENIAEEGVIWSNLSIAAYIPVMTKHYPLFTDSSTPHPVPDRELEERYLLWRTLEGLDLEGVQRDFGLLGAGPEKEQPLAINNQVRFCNILSKFVEKNCPPRTNAITLRGSAYFEDLLTQFASVKERQIELLSKYNVSYIMVDTRRDTFALPFATSTAVYTDGRFFIYSTNSFLNN